MTDDSTKIAKITSKLNKLVRELTVIRAVESQKESTSKSLHYFTKQCQQAQDKIEQDVKLIDQKLEAALAKLDTQKLKMESKLAQLKLEQEQLEARIEAFSTDKETLVTKAEQAKSKAENAHGIVYYQEQLETALKRSETGRPKGKAEMLKEMEIADLKKALKFYQTCSDDSLFAPKESPYKQPPQEAPQENPKPKLVIKRKETKEPTLEDKKRALTDEMRRKMEEAEAKHSERIQACKEAGAPDIEFMMNYQMIGQQIEAIQAWYKVASAELEGLEYVENKSCDTSERSSDQSSHTSEPSCYEENEY